MKPPAQKRSLFSSLLGPVTGADQLRLEKARLEAFLDAFPGEYCGFHQDGSVAYSQGFCGLLGVSTLTCVEDIQGTLDTGDAAALEGQFLKLEQTGAPFSLKVQRADKKRILRLSGARGTALEQEDQFNILWLEDISQTEADHKSLKNTRETAEKELKILQASFDNLPLPVWMRDGNTDLIWCNQAYAAALNAPVEDILSAQLELTVSGKKKSPKDMAREALHEGRKVEERGHLIIGGKRKWMALHERPLEGTTRTLGFACDLTREEELQAELARYVSANKGLLEQLGTAIAIFDSAHVLEFFNAAFAHLWGLEDQWLNTKPKLGDILEKLRENRRLPEQADFRKYKQDWLNMFTRLIEPHEEMLYLPDGSALRRLAIPHPMGGLMMTFEDVTSRLELESSYNTLIAVQRETLDNLSEGIIVYGGDGRVRLSNPAFAKLWNLNPEDLNGKPHISRLIEKMAPFFDQMSWDSLKNRLISHGLDRNEQSGRLLRKDDVNLEYATIPLPDGGVMVSYHDVSDSVRVENALRDKNEALLAAEQLKTDFLANVSYQLRTPLNAIMGFSEILEYQYFGNLNDRQKEYTQGIHEAGDRLISLIDDILDLATIDAGYLELKKADMDVRTLLEGLYGVTQDWARKSEIDLILSPLNRPVIINADEQRLKQALLNLIRNAIHFTPKGGQITLSSTEAVSGKGIRISVTDTGVGIPQEDLERILLPFERVQSGRVGQGGIAAEKGTDRGAGLGLTLVKNIIELHGGTLTIESAEGKGTSVHIDL